MDEPITAIQTLHCSWSVHKFIEVNFSKLTDNNKIFRNDFDCIHYHLCKISSKIIECKMFAPKISSKWTLYNYLYDGTFDHRVDSVIESSLSSKIMHGIIWAETFVKWLWTITNQFLKIWLLSVNIINFKGILIFLILHTSRINEVRLQNLYLALYKYSP